MFKTRLVLMVVLVAFVAAPVQASPPYGPVIWSDNMDAIAATGWTDLRDGPGQGAGWLYQDAGSLGVDYSKTYNSDGIAPYLLENPLAIYDYQGINVGSPAGTFDVGGAGAYLGDNDREISRPTGPGFPNLVPGVHVFVMDIYRAPVVAGYANPEHIRELQLYDSTGARNCYQVIAEVGADQQPTGWATYLVDLNPWQATVFEGADLNDITKITLWATAWSAYPSTAPPGPGQCTTPWPVWPGDYTVNQQLGQQLKVDDLRIIPEPATMTLLALGGLALLRRRKA